ncbi:MAG: ABC transporter ATP-binding protein/permease [Olsenella sp.]|jgi:ATP-binding cassette subfamily B protein|nr:ABC transporter ATP-binding protein/permease [Olsenella sp.]MCI1289121.1 ABC transporter ATP-binding protein/permease [Olsenella sp.]
MSGSLEGEGEKDAANGADGASGGAPQPRMAPFVRPQWKVLAVVCVTGVAYNVGMVAGPWLEGLLAQRLADILAGRAVAASMVPLACAYVAAIAAVQLMRYLKRLYVRKFANNVNRAMKRTLYHNLLLADERTLEREGVGSLMTKALSDVDDCVEGVRKFTTEIFDTGVVMVAYMAMLLAYDWRTTLLALVFPPLSYVLAARMKQPVTRATAAAKQSVSGMATAALDRVEGATSYRALGLEGVRDRLFERDLADYERKETRANVLSTALMPVYQAISLLGAGTVIVCGARDVLGVGWAAWNIAAFTTFFSVFTKLAVKSSHAGKLFNAVQRAQVSWRRIQPYMGQAAADDFAPAAEAPRFGQRLDVRDLCFAFPGEAPLFRRVTFAVAPGQVVGVTGEVGCGKSTLGRLLCGELSPTAGSVRLGERDVATLRRRGLGFASRLGHDPQLLDASVADNVLLGDDADPRPDLRRACLLAEAERMPQGLRTPVGEGGAALSGGQRARLALARTYHFARPLVVLDDPFASVDLDTERRAWQGLRELARERGMAVVVTSHRLLYFPELDGVVCLHDGTASFGPHERLMAECPSYARLFDLQANGGEVDLDVER